MAKTEYRRPPATPDAHLEQLAALEQAPDNTLSKFQKMMRKSALSERSRKALRNKRIQEMAVVGYSPEQIKLAFIALDSPLNVLVDGLQTKSGMKTFHTEVRDAVNASAILDAAERRVVYVQGRQRLLDVCWGLVARGEHTIAILELMEKLQRDVAEAHGAIHERVGKRPSTRQPDPVPDAAASPKAEEGDPEAVADLNWEEGFEPDDSEDSTAIKE